VNVGEVELGAGGVMRALVQEGRVVPEARCHSGIPFIHMCSFTQYLLTRKNSNGASGDPIQTLTCSLNISGGWKPSHFPHSAPFPIPNIFKVDTNLS